MIFPFLCLSTVNVNKFARTVDDNPVVYEFIRKNNGLSTKISQHNETNSAKSFSISQTSPLLTLP